MMIAIFLLCLILSFKKVVPNNDTTCNTTQSLDLPAAQSTTKAKTFRQFSISIRNDSGGNRTEFITKSSFRSSKVQNIKKEKATTASKKINKIANIRNGTVLNMKETFDPTNSKISTSSKTYEEFLRNSDIFLDTSLLIKHIMQMKKADVIMLCFPQRWGKTTNLQMIKYFLEARVDKVGLPMDFKQTPNFRLFVHGEVGSGKQMVKLQNPFLIANEKDILYNHIAKWPVIYLNFTRVIGHTFEEFEKSLLALLRDAFKDHQYVRMSLHKAINSKRENPDEKEEAKARLEEYTMHLDGKAPPEEKFFCLGFLCEVLHFHFGRKVYILIDDFDYGFNYMRLSNITFTKAQKVLYFDLLRTVLIHTHLSNLYLEKWIITSNFNYGKHSIFPPLDEVFTFDLMDDYVSSFFGFNQTEADMLFDLMKLPQELRDDARDRYWGYNTGKLGIKNKYCTWSIVNMVNNKQVQDYWMDLSYKEDYLQKYLRIPKFRQTIGTILNSTRQKIRIRDRNITMDDHKYMELASNYTYKQASNNPIEMIFNDNPHLEVFRNDSDFRDLFDWSESEEEWITEAFTKLAIYKFLYMSGYITLERIPNANKTEVFWATFPNKEVQLGMQRYLEMKIDKSKSEEFY